jgi:hypothetical protein
MSERQTQKLVREGAYIAEVDVTLNRRGDLAAAARLARVYELKPVAAE